MRTISLQFHGHRTLTGLAAVIFLQKSLNYKSVNMAQTCYHVKKRSERAASKSCNKEESKVFGHDKNHAHSFLNRQLHFRS